MAGYDDLYAAGGEIFGEKPDILTEHILKYKTSGTALDIGSGYGRNALWLAEHGFDVTAVDLSPVAIGQLTAKAKTLGISITAKAEDVRNIELTNPYDAILIFFVLHHLLDREARRLIHCLQEFTSVGGLNLIATFTADGDFYRAKEDTKNRFFPKLGELKEIYAGWEILEYREENGKAFHKKPSGEHSENISAYLMARKRG